MVVLGFLIWSVGRFVRSFGVKFGAVVDWSALFNLPEVRLNRFVSYKRLDLPLAIVKVFRKSILVSLRSSMDIKGLPVREAEVLARSRVSEVLKLLPSAIRVLDGDVVNVHNAFVNHPTARHNVTVKVGDDVRLISDNSKGNLEFEAVHPSFAVSDSEVLERFNADLISNNPEPLSIQQSKLGFVVDVLDKYAMQMDLHLAVERKTSDTLDLIAKSLSNTDVLQGVSPVCSPIPHPATFSRDDVVSRSKAYRLWLARKYLSEFGWSSGNWGG